MSAGLSPAELRENWGHLEKLNPGKKGGGSVRIEREEGEMGSDHTTKPGGEERRVLREHQDARKKARISPRFRGTMENQKTIRGW